MKALRIALIIAATFTASLLPRASAQNSGTAPNQGTGNGGNASVQNALRITAPAPGQVLNQNFVQVKYELANQGVSGSPNFRVQLDDRDPVVTTFSEYTFTGLRPGEHTVSVDLVDANNTPVAGTHSEIHFNVAGSRPTVAPGRSVAAANEQLKLASIGDATDDALPPAGSALPLLSVIGFGALLGGIASALRTR